MSSLELRPRFKLNTYLTKEQIKEKITQMVAANQASCKISITDNHLFLRIPEEQRHYWSPFLSIEFGEDDKKLVLKGVFGPSPAVWTMFMFLYIGVAFIGMIGLFYGLSQLTLNMQPTGLWLVPVTIVLEITLYLIARTGQRLAGQQMQDMYQFLENLIQTNQENTNG